MRLRGLPRPPIRRRLVAGFTALTFVVLVAAGVFVYWRFDVALNRDLDNELIHSGRTLAPLVNEDGRMTDRVLAAAPGVNWQILDNDGQVLDSDSPVTRAPLLTEKQFAKISEGDITFNVGALLPVSDEPYRVRLVSVGSGPGYHLLVAARRDQRDQALRDLLGQLLLAGILILGLTAWIADWLARSALSPVERYRQRAEEIAAGDADLRLQVPSDRDDEITRLGHTFNDMLATLDQALARERQFVSEASHELRTPVTLLSSRIQLALRRERTPAEHEQVLRELQVDLDRLARLAEQLLHRNPQPRKEIMPMDLRTVVERVVASRRAVAHEAPESLSCVLPQEPASVRVPVVEAERVLTNLVDNAFLHGRPPVRVEVDLPDADWVRLRVTDAGDGVAPGLLGRLTHRFTRSAEARTRPGSGLGLALVHSLVVENHGQLLVCHGGRHVRHRAGGPQHGAHPGFPRPVKVGESASDAPPAPECDHSEEMTVTVLLPRSARTKDPR